jgi:sec-independent protein translocase protein TatA
MGPIGGPEAVFIFFLALMLFGPKKLPELGRTVGKALADFQRAKTEIMAAFERETKQLALDTEMLTSAVNQYHAETCAIEASPYGSTYQSSYGSEPSEPYVSSASHTSAPEGEPAQQAVLPEAAIAVAVS